MLIRVSWLHVYARPAFGSNTDESEKTVGFVSAWTQRSEIIPEVYLSVQPISGSKHIVASGSQVI